MPENIEVAEIVPAAVDVESNWLSMLGGKKMCIPCWYRTFVSVFSAAPGTSLASVNVRRIVPIASWTTFSVVVMPKFDIVFTANFEVSSVKVVVSAMMYFREVSPAGKAASRDSWIVMAPVVCLAQGFLMLDIVSRTS